MGAFLDLPQPCATSQGNIFDEASIFLHLQFTGIIFSFQAELSSDITMLADYGVARFFQMTSTATANLTLSVFQQSCVIIDHFTLCSQWRNCLYQCKSPSFLNQDNPTELSSKCSTSKQLVKALAFTVENESFIVEFHSQISAFTYQLCLHFSGSRILSTLDM